jgi:hypothetical protein
VAVIATGGMSHQISGARFGMANEEWDREFLKRIESDMDALVAIPQEEIMRIGGTEAAELAIWFAMRAALAPTVKRAYDFYTFPQITGCGVVVFDELTS